MKKFLLFIILSLVMVRFDGYGQYITSEDNVGNYISWTNSSNQGFGFAAWNLWTTGNAGSFIGSSHAGLINTGGNAFGMWGNLGSFNAQRHFTSPLNTNQIFTIELSVHWRDGNRGIDILNSSNGVLFNFDINNSGYGATGWDWLDNSAIRLTVTQTSSNQFTVSAFRINNGDTWSSTTQSGTVSGFKAYVANTSGGSNRDFFINNLKVETASASAVAANANVKINGSVQLAFDQTLTTNNLTIPGGSSFTLKSTAAGTGSLITNGIVSGVITIERHAVGGWGSWDAGWHAISAPVANQVISAFTTSGDNNGYDFYGWAENTNTWMNFKAGTFSAWNGGTNFNTGQGYLISYETNQTDKAFTGTINTGNIPKTNLSFTNGQGNGWHLLGNPFSSALKWETANWDRTNVIGTAKIWSASGKSYVDIPADGIIPSAQGFMVQVNSATNSITIPAASRLHHAQNWYKNGNNTKIQLVAAEANNASQQESNILVNTQATAGFDFEYDSRFLPGYAPQFYSLAAAEKLSTNSLPSLNNAASIPFGFVKNQATNFKIELKEKIEGQTIFLTDLKTNVSQNLNNNPVYSFTAAQGDNPNRFIVHFGMVGTGEQPTTQALNAYVYGKTLYLVSEKGQAQLQIFDVRGRMLQSNRIDAKGVVSQTLALPAGVYLLRLQSADATQSVKIFVQ